MQKIFSPWVFFVLDEENFFKFLSQNFWTKVFLVFVLDEKKNLQIFILKLPCQIVSNQIFSLSLKNFSEKYLAENDKKLLKKEILTLSEIDRTDAN